jgi:GcrA cell cycle regulator
MGHTPEGIAAITISRTTWTSSEDAFLAKLWREGKSASKIAEQIPGKSRNAVIGRAHRLRAQGWAIASRPREPGKPRKRYAPRDQAVKPRAPRQRHYIKLVPNEPFLPPKPLPRITDTLEGSVTLFDLTGCKWPVTARPPHRFCNRERMECGPYCEGHTVRATQPREPKRRFLEAAE